MNKSQNKSNKSTGNTTTAEDEDRKMRKLFVDRLNASITEDDIYSVFSKHGEIEEVAKYQDRRAPSRYFAFVVYKYAKDCVKATYDPCPIIRGRKCNCMLAAIGKQFSGYKFFAQKGLLTEEEKQNQKNNNNQNNNNKRNNNNNNKQKRNQNNNNKNSNNNNNNKPKINTNMPSFNTNDSHHSTRSAIISNYSNGDTPINYDNYPSWQSQQFDSQRSYSTNISELQPQSLPKYNQSKSQNFYNYNQNNQNNIRRNNRIYKQHSNGYNNNQNVPYVQYQQHSNPNNTYYQQQMPQIQPQQQQQIPQPQYTSYSYNNNNNNTRHIPQQRTRAQSMNNVLQSRPAPPQQYYQPQPQPQPQPQLQSYSYSQMQPQPHRKPPPPQTHYSPQLTSQSRPQPILQPQSVSYNQLPHINPNIQSAPTYNSLKISFINRTKIQQQSAPKLPGPDVTIPTKSHHSNPSMPLRSHSARSSQSAHSVFTPPDTTTTTPINDLDDLFDQFGDLNVQLTPTGLPRTPSPPPCLLLNAGAKPSIDMDRDELFDTLQVPPLQKPKTFTSISDAKKATDAELETGFTMLDSPTPTATASVHTEYNDSSDLNNFELNTYKN